MTGDGPQPLTERVVALLDTIEHEGGSAVAATSRSVAKQLDEPLRVAIVGRPNAGKSTFVNALLGRAVAPTGADATIPTPVWYRHGGTVEAVAIFSDGNRRPVGYRSGTSGAEVDLGESDPAAVRRIEVFQPLDLLRSLTLIDTPGISSTSGIARGVDTTAPQPLGQDPAELPDVVLYLLREAKEQDIDFLQTDAMFRPAEADPLRAIGILSRADELGGGRGDALQLASVLARQLGPRLSPVLASLHPVSGLLALAAEQADDAELEAVARLASMPLQAIDLLVRSADTLVRPDPAIPGDPAMRRALIDRFGMFGVRHVLGMLLSGAAEVADIRSHLRRLGGLDPIRDLLIERFATRTDVLRTATALTIVDRLIPEIDNPAIQRRLDAELDRIQAESFELRELHHLRLLHLTPDLRLDDEERAVIERCLGGQGTAPHQRVGAQETATTSELRTLAFEAKRQLASLRGARRSARNAAETATRSLDRLLVQLEDRSSA